MGPHYVDFTFAFDTTLLRLEMTEIWPKYVAQAFMSPPLRNRQLRGPPGIGLIILTLKEMGVEKKVKFKSLMNYCFGR